MFATVIVDLPSPCIGGDIIVSQNRDSAKERISWSWFDTNYTRVLAWYTDVVHEVSHVTQGHRMVLSYNLIQTQPDTTSPNYHPPTPITDEAKTAKLREVLGGWADDKYPPRPRLPRWLSDGKDPDLPFFAYVLDHNYSTSDLASGLSCLKGADNHKVSLLSPLAKEFGVKLAIATIQHKAWGNADDHDQYEEQQAIKRWTRDLERKANAKPGSNDDDDEDEYSEDEESEGGQWYGSASMIPGQCHERTYTFNTLVDAAGKTIVQKPKHQEGDKRKAKRQKQNHLVVHDYHGVIIPEDAFGDDAPDDSEYEQGYMGNVSALSLPAWPL